MTQITKVLKNGTIPKKKFKNLLDKAKLEELFCNFNNVKIRKDERYAEFDLSNEDIKKG